MPDKPPDKPPEKTPDDSQIIALAAKTIEQAFIGVLSTIDANGRPHSRHMAAAANNEQLQRLYCITATGTRKVEEIRDNPHVCWLFTDDKYEHIVRLTGEAHFASTSDLPMSVWNRLSDTTEAYVASDLREKDHFDFRVLVTEVETLELYCPRLGLLAPHTIDLDR